MRYDTSLGKYGGKPHPGGPRSTLCISSQLNWDNSAEDSEVWMDLTDDLLHMVFSFLDHINLGAAMVCRQWRAASAHEEFWRCLNFDDKNISAEQCKG